MQSRAAVSWMTSGYSQTWLRGQHWDQITNIHLDRISTYPYFTLCLNGTRYYDNHLRGIHLERFDCIQTSATQHDELRDSQRVYYCGGLRSKTVHAVTSASSNCTCLYGEAVAATLPSWLHTVQYITLSRQTAIPSAELLTILIRLIVDITGML